MDGASLAESPAAARVRMVAQPASVPAARRFIDDALTQWGLEELVDDVGLCVTELSTNATLHSDSRFFEIVLHAEPADRPRAVQLSVYDDGAGASSIAVHSELSPDPFDDAFEALVSATGRGLMIVSSLASAWGVDDLDSGTRVWALFADEVDEDLAQKAPVVTGAAPKGSAELPERGEDWAQVHLLDCPVALLLAHDENVSDMIRELRLVELAGGHDAGRLAATMEEVVRRHEVNWGAGLVMARSALLAGHEHADIHVLSSRHPGDDLAALREAMDAAEELSRAGVLMTLPASEEVERVRAWMAGEYLTQAQDSGPATPYPAWLERNAG